MLHPGGDQVRTKPIVSDGQSYRVPADLQRSIRALLDEGWAVRPRAGGGVILSSPDQVSRITVPSSANLRTIANLDNLMAKAMRREPAPVAAEEPYRVRRGTKMEYDSPIIVERRHADGHRSYRCIHCDYVGQTPQSVNAHAAWHSRGDFTPEPVETTQAPAETPAQVPVEPSVGHSCEATVLLEQVRALLAMDGQVEALKDALAKETARANRAVETLSALAELAQENKE